jgi:hypothetical protein
VAYFLAGQKLTASVLNGLVPLYKQKLTSETVTNMNSTTYQNDDELFLPVEANTTYRMLAYLKFDAAANAGIKFSWTGPTGATMTWSPYGADSSQVVGAGYNMRELAIGGDGNLSTSGVGTTDTCRPGGLLIVSSTAGNLQLRWAQRVAQLSNVRVSDRSWLKLEKVLT